MLCVNDIVAHPVFKQPNVCITHHIDFIEKMKEKYMTQRVREMESLRKYIRTTFYIRAIHFVYALATIYTISLTLSLSLSRAHCFYICFRNSHIYDFLALIKVNLRKSQFKYGVWLFHLKIDFLVLFTYIYVSSGSTLFSVCVFGFTFVFSLRFDLIQLLFTNFLRIYVNVQAVNICSVFF